MSSFLWGRACACVVPCNSNGKDAWKSSAFLSDMFGVGNECRGKWSFHTCFPLDERKLERNLWGWTHVATEEEPISLSSSMDAAQTTPNGNHQLKSTTFASRISRIIHVIWQDNFPIFCTLKFFFSLRVTPIETHNPVAFSYYLNRFFYYLKNNNILLQKYRQTKSNNII